MKYVINKALYTQNHNFQNHDKEFVKDRNREKSQNIKLSTQNKNNFY